MSPLDRQRFENVAKVLERKGMSQTSIRDAIAPCDKCGAIIDRDHFIQWRRGTDTVYYLCSSCDHLLEHAIEFDR